MQKAQSDSLTFGNRERHCNTTFASTTPGSFFPYLPDTICDIICDTICNSAELQCFSAFFRANPPVSSQCRCAIGADKTMMFNTV